MASKDTEDTDSKNQLRRIANALETIAEALEKEDVDVSSVPGASGRRVEKGLT